MILAGTIRDSKRMKLFTKETMRSMDFWMSTNQQQFHIARHLINAHAPVCTRYSVMATANVELWRCRGQEEVQEDFL